jgi:hypothetical protein
MSSRATTCKSSYRRPPRALSTRVGLHLSPALREALEAEAMRRGVTISSLARGVLQDALLGQATLGAP